MTYTIAFSVRRAFKSVIGSKEVLYITEEEQQKCTLVASHRTPSTGALERFCEFFSCMQLEYCLREPLSKFEGLSTFYCNFINVNILYYIYGTYGPFLLYVLPYI